MKKTAVLFALISLSPVVVRDRPVLSQSPERDAAERNAAERNAAGDREKKSWEKEPSFKDDRFRESFEKAKGLFEKGEYRQAGGEFSRAARGAASRDDRELIQKWRVAVKLVPLVERAKKYIEIKRYQEAYAYLQKLRPQVEETPAMPVWERLAAELDELLFLPLEGFDTGRRNFPPGMSYVDDPEKVFRGPRALHWKNPRDRSSSALRLSNVPKSLEPFDAIELWVQSEKKVPVEVFILTDDPLDKKRGAAQPGQVVSSYMLPVTLQSPPGKWRRMELKLTTFQIQGNASLDAVKDIQIQIRAGRTFDLLVDEIRLMRKNPGKDGSRARRR